MLGKKLRYKESLEEKKEAFKRKCATWVHNQLLRFAFSGDMQMFPWLVRITRVSDLRYSPLGVKQKRGHKMFY